VLEQATMVRERAYAPYSKFKVGAALEAVTGEVFVGCNVENASFGLTICAERAALVRAVSAGVRQFRRIVVVTDTEPPAAPCGACRQVLAEFGTDLQVEAVGPSSTKRWRIRDLLPDSFGPESLA